MSEAPFDQSQQPQPAPAAAPGAPATAPRPPVEGGAVKPVLTQSQAKRANQSLKGMVISVLLTLAVALPVIALNPANNPDVYKRDIDVAEVATQAAAAADFTPLSPALPEGWYANFARWVPAGADGVAYWEVGFVNGDEGFVWMRQTGNANPSWIAFHTGNAPVTGVRTIDGTDWELRDKTGERTIILERDGSTVLLGGDSFEDLDEAGRAVMKALSPGPNT